MPTQYRVRARGGFEDHPLVVVQTRHQADPISTTTSSFKRGTREEMCDFVTKPFVPGRTWANNPMTKTRTTFDFTAGSYSAASSWPPQVGDTIAVNGQFCGAFDDEFLKDRREGNLFDYDHLNTESATRCLAKVRKPEVNGLVSLAEAGSTIRMLLNPLQGLLRFLDARSTYALRTASRQAAGQQLSLFENASRTLTPLQKRKAQKAKAYMDRLKRRYGKETAAAIADTHLAVVFGAMPFINDCNGVLEVLRDGGTKVEMNPTTVRASTQETASSSRTIPGHLGIKWQLSYTRSVTSRAYATFRIKQGYESTAERLGFSFDEIPRAVWQAIPYSFLLDWVANVQHYIGSLRPQSGVEMLSSGISVVIVDAHSAIHQSSSGSDGPWTWSHGFASQSKVEVTTHRVPGGLGDRRGIVVRAAARNIAEDIFKVTSLTSLITQKLVKLR